MFWFVRGLFWENNEWYKHFSTLFNKTLFAGCMSEKRYQALLHARLRWICTEKQRGSASAGRRGLLPSEPNRSEQLCSGRIHVSAFPCIGKMAWKSQKKRTPLFYSFCAILNFSCAESRQKDQVGHVDKSRKVSSRKPCFLVLQRPTSEGTHGSGKIGQKRLHFSCFQTRGELGFSWQNETGVGRNVPGK